MKNSASNKKAVAKKAIEKIDKADLKKIKGGQTPTHRVNYAKGKCAIA